MNYDSSAIVRFLMNVRPMEVGSVLKTLLRIHRRDIAVGKLTLWLDPASYFGYELMTTGQYDPGMTSAIRDILHEGDTFVDLGGNEGYFSLIAADLVGQNGRVICIEPQQRLWPVLLSNFALNSFPQCSLAPYAIGEQNDHPEIILTPSYNTGGSTLVPGVRGFRAMFWPRQRVFMTTLNEFCRQYKLTDIKLVKVDIEGFELIALQSASSLLEHHAIRNLLIELHPEQLDVLGQSPDQVHALLDSYGYQHKLLHNVHWYSCVTM